MSFYDSDDYKIQGSPSLEAVRPKATPSLSPRPGMPVSGKPPQSDVVLMSWLAPNNPEIALEAGKRRLNSASQSEAEQSEDERANKSKDIWCLKPTATQGSNRALVSTPQNTEGARIPQEGSSHVSSGSAAARRKKRKKVQAVANEAEAEGDLETAHSLLLQEPHHTPDDLAQHIEGARVEMAKP